MDIQKTIARACVELLKGNPFYGHVIAQFPKILTETIPTMAIGKTNKDGLLFNLYVNPKYIEALYSQYPKDKAFNHIVEVIKHETLHAVFKHPFLDKPNRDALTLACEIEVNSYVNKDNLIQKGLYASQYGFSERLGVEEYYKLLNNNKNDLNDKKQTHQNSNSQGSQLDSHDTWKAIVGDGRSEILLKDIVRKAKDTTVQTNQWGRVPGEIAALIDDLLEIKETKVPWQVVLKNFIASSSETILDYTNKRISKRFGTRPGTKKENTLKLAIGIDTSGSIDNNTLEMFFSEIHWIAKNNAEIIVFECDCAIGREYPFKAFDGKNITGRGGTDLEPVIKEASDRHFDALIYFTDGYAPKIATDYNIPVMFVLSGGYGHITNIKDLPYPAQIVFEVQRNGEVKYW